MGDTLEAFAEWACLTGAELVDMTHNLLRPLAELLPPGRGCE